MSEDYDKDYEKDFGKADEPSGAAGEVQPKEDKKRKKKEKKKDESPQAADESPSPPTVSDSKADGSGNIKPAEGSSKSLKHTASLHAVTSTNALKRAGSRRSSNASTMGMDEETRERHHLVKQNGALRKQVKQIKGQIRQLREAEGGPTSVSDQKAIEQFNLDSEQYQKDIDLLKIKLAQVSDVDTLESLQDELADKQIQVKALQLMRRNLADNSRVNGKLLHQADVMPSRQKVFLDLKDERKRHQRKVDNMQRRHDQIQEHLKSVIQRAEEAMAKEKAAGLTDIEYATIVNLVKKNEEQVKLIEKLMAQTGILQTTFQTISTQTEWAAKDKEELLDKLRMEISVLENQINQREQTIMSNQGLKEKPPHFLKPLPDEIEEPKLPKQPKTARPPPPQREHPPASAPPPSTGRKTNPTAPAAVTPTATKNKKKEDALEPRPPVGDKPAVTRPPSSPQAAPAQPQQVARTPPDSHDDGKLNDLDEPEQKYSDDEFDSVQPAKKASPKKTDSPRYSDDEDHKAAAAHGDEKQKEPAFLTDF